MPEGVNDKCGVILIRSACAWTNHIPFDQD